MTNIKKNLPSNHEMVFTPLCYSMASLNGSQTLVQIETMAGGYPFYGNESIYENKILLSNNGLQGAGSINFLTASAVSNKLTLK